STVDSDALADTAFSLATTRAAFEHRAAVVASDHDQARAALAALAAGETPAGLVTGVTRGRPKLAVVFTGQGAQRVGMGRELYDR
ncbi:hypothetical protein NGM37_01370, partial [Streptomyces sp. TRM76130]|nr:hypothetical protein [Streptomyces sp. TRM76130]